MNYEGQESVSSYFRTINSVAGLPDTIPYEHKPGANGPDTAISMLYNITLGTRRIGCCRRNVTKCLAVVREAAGFGVIYRDENNIDYSLRFSALLTQTAVGNQKDREKNKISL